MVLKNIKVYNNINESARKITNAIEIIKKYRKREEVIDVEGSYHQKSSSYMPE